VTRRRSWRPSPGRRRQAGFTLLEVLVALTILAVGVVSLIQLSSQSLRLVKVSGDYQQAAQLANRIATGSAPTEEGVESGEEGRFRWERRASLVQVPEELLPKETLPDREPPKLFALTVAVSWGENQSLELATLYTPFTGPPPPQSTNVPGTLTPTIPVTVQSRTR
jgi:prepilin-type N-terminal cleavage/methylation domain-containing protein